MRRGWRLIGLLGAVVSVGGWACDSTPCEPMAAQLCPCPVGREGAQVCAADGSRFGPCDCSGTGGGGSVVVSATGASSVAESVGAGASGAGGASFSSGDGASFSSGGGGE